jgi:hypothetical protein
MPPGDYEVMGEGADRVVTGDCAGCGLTVKPGDPHVIRYHPEKAGGIFHARCRPIGDGWYSLDDQGEAPDV